VNKRITPHIPLWDRIERDDGTFSRADLIFDKKRDIYVCTAGNKLTRPYQRRSSNAIIFIGHLLSCYFDDAFSMAAAQRTSAFFCMRLWPQPNRSTTEERCVYGLLFRGQIDALLVGPKQQIYRLPEQLMKLFQAPVPGESASGLAVVSAEATARRCST
jgi:hypothetical protein